MNNYFWFYKSDDEWRYFSSQKKAIAHANKNGYELNEERTSFKHGYIVLGNDYDRATVTKEYVE